MDNPEKLATYGE